MTSATPPAVGMESLPDEEAPIETMRRWFLPTPGSVDRGLFERALRAAASAWQPNWFGASRSKLGEGPIMALPEILEAWRATERELAGIAGDSPDREILQANATMLRAMYQRLYRERTGR